MQKKIGREGKKVSSQTHQMLTDIKLEKINSFPRFSLNVKISTKHFKLIYLQKKVD